MSSAPPSVLRSKALWLILGLGILLLAGGVLWIMPSRLPPSIVPVRPAQVQKTDSLENVRQALKGKPDLMALRTAIHDLNAYLAKHPDQAIPPLPAGDRDWLARFCLLDQGELNEVSNSSFTLLDAHFLDMCLLLHDAARSLRLDSLPPRESALAAFDWVVRQVYLRESGQPPAPPQFVLRRGWGSDRERALVFLALLDAAGVPGGMVVVPLDESGQLRYWIPAALADKQVYLFDTRLGVPLSGPDGKGVATLADLHGQPDKILPLLNMDKAHPYDVSAGQIRKAQVRVGCPLSALAPRMTWLQKLLPDGAGYRFARPPRDLVAPWKDFAAATRVPVKVWNAPNDPATPFHVLRGFLPPGEGGSDKTSLRRQLYQADLIPLRALPDAILQVPDNTDLKIRLVYNFAQPFLSIDSDRPPPEGDKAGQTDAIMSAACPQCGFRDNVPRELEGLEHQCRQCKSRFVVHGGPAIETPDLAMLRFARFPLGAHDFLVRGQLDKAADKLVQTLDRIRQQQEAVPTQELERELQQEAAKWLSHARDVQVQLIDARRSYDLNKSPQNARLVQDAEVKMEGCWQSSGKIGQVLWLIASRQLAIRASYLLALCKQEKAARLQASKVANSQAPREAWQSAAKAWQDFLDEYERTGLSIPARIMLAQALEMLGQPDDAVKALETISVPVGPWTRHGLRYRASQIRARQAAQ